MLSDHERRVLDDLERCFEPDDERHPTGFASGIRPVRHSRRTLVVAAFAGWICLLLVITGAALSALALLLATALVGVLWHSWPRLRNQGAGASRASARRGKVS